MGRFINADAYASTGQGVLGNNMFAYCGNNPVKRYDPTGYEYDPIIARSEFFYSEFTHSYGGRRSYGPSGFLAYRAPRGTLSIGITGSASAGVGGSGTSGLTVDRVGNMGVFRTQAAYATSSYMPSCAYGFCISFTDSYDVDDLQGAATVEGGTINIFGLSVSFEHSFFEDASTGEIYNGYAFTIGPTISAPLEVHAGITASDVYYFNLFDWITALLEAAAY